MTSAAHWRDAVKAADDGDDKLGVSANNAGLWRGGRVDETTEEECDLMSEVNANAVSLGTRAAIPAIRRAGGGSIIQVASNVAMTGIDRATADPAAKGAVRALSKQATIQYAGEGIRANLLHPDPVESALLRRVGGQN